MSAPTLWEEGRMSGRRVTRLALILGLLLLVSDLLMTGGLGILFDLGFVALCLWTALAVRPGDFFAIAVLPPLLLLGLVVVVGVAHPVSIADPGDGLIQAAVSGLAHHASALMLAYLLVLGVLAMRQRVLEAQAKRAGSPSPTRTTTGTSSE